MIGGRVKEPIPPGPGCWYNGLAWAASGWFRSQRLCREMRGSEQAPLLKTWKVKSGESTCMYFDGKVCK